MQDARRDMGELTPRAGSVERWAWDYVCSESLSHKLSPPPLPPHFDGCVLTHLPTPGRPRELRVSWRKVRTPGREALRDPKRRAQLLHTFLHHELQAAELMCWAVLAYPDTPIEFRRGLLAICSDEIRHMGAYAQHLQMLGYRVGDFDVRDWFWERAPAATRPGQFCALMGLGFEAGNLDHCERFAERFEYAGDAGAAALTRKVGDEEIAHVAFAARWFRHFEGELCFSQWCQALPAPLSPMVMRGRPVNHSARRRAGFSADFLQELEAWQPSSPGG